MIKVLGLGDNVVDHYLHTNMMYPGGNAFNFAAYARLLGHTAGYLGVFGDDAPALHINRTAQELGIDLSHCRFEAGENGHARVTLVDGDRVFLPSNKGGASRLHPLQLTRLDEAYISQYDLVHSSRFSYTEAVIPRLHVLGMRVSFDFSHIYPEDYLEQVCPYLYCAVLSGGGQPEEQLLRLAEHIQALGPYLVLITRGAAGALLLAGGELYQQSPCLVEAIDTLGAGDSFLTAFLCNYVDGMRLASDFPAVDDQRGITSKQAYERALIQVSLHQAAVFSAQSCLRLGAFGFGVEFRQ
jgi:sugar/nucleoside kinase (ribokinase family)